MRKAHRQSRATPLAKLTRPHLRGAYLRERLFAKLDTCRQVPVVWITGPPGAGKTMLAATWLEKRKRPGIWYQLDAGDSDPATFFYYLKHAAEAAAAKGKGPLPLLTAEYLADVPGFARRWFRELSSRLPAGAVLALDNYQELTAESGLHRALAAACREIPSGAQLLVMSWGDPPAELAPLIADERLVRLDPDVLKLSLEEAKGIATGQEAFSPEQLRELHAQCDGWAAGFTLLRERARRTGLVGRIEQRGSMQEVFDYFAAQAFRDAAPESRDTLVKTAFFPRFTEAMAREVSGNARAGELLEGLHRRHLFVERRHGEEVTYQYHMLFRAFLLEEARRQYTAVGLADLSRRAAAALERVGMAEEAVRLLLEGSDTEGAARLVETLAPGLVAAGRGAALAEWIGRLPQEQREGRPWLSYWLGAGTLGVDLVRARACFERAHAAFVRDGDRTGQAMAVVGVLQTHFLELDDLNAIQPWLRILEPLFVEEPVFPSPDVAAGIYGTLVGLMFWAAPGHPLFPRCVERLEALLTAPLSPDVKVTAGGELVERFGMAGMVREADRIISAVEPLVRSAAVSPLARALWWVRSCRRDYAVGDFEAVRIKLDGALSVARENAFHFLLTLVHGLKADVALCLHQLDAVPAIVERMKSTLPMERRQAVGRVHWVQARLAALRGDLQEALRECEAACAVVEANGLSMAQYGYSLTSSSVRMELGDLARARIALDRVRSLYPQAPVLLAAAAVLASRSGEHAAWRSDLGRALARLRERRAAVPVPNHPLLARQVSELALSEGIETAYVRAWIRKVHLRPSSPDVPNWPWAVRVRTLGPFGVELDDAPLAFSGKAPRKPLELLQALVALGGRGVSAEALCAHLWPDSEGDAADAALRMAVTRLRKLLRCDGAVLLRDGKLSLDDGLCWVDVWSLERLLGEIEARPQPAHGPRLLELYRGAFLASERERPWMLGPRERLRRRFVAAAGKLAEVLAREGQHDLAIALCDKALDQDPTAEAIHRQIMSAHLALGRRAEALAAYRRCRESLAAAMRLAPSGETEALRRQAERAD